MTLLVRRFRVVSMQFLRVHVALPSYVRPVSPAPKVHILKISCPFSLVRKKKKYNFVLFSFSVYFKDLSKS